MKISKNEIKQLLFSLGYKETIDDFFEKSYEGSYKIGIHFGKEKIYYPNPITLGDKTTSNFSSSENFVVLECVDRLLEKGYKPENIALEHKWAMGRREKGKLDILIRDKDGKTFLMIECKTWEQEYKKEKNRMLRNGGGQLFSYYQQDKNARYLCLYTSRLKSNDEVEYHNDIVVIEPSFKELGDIKEVFSRWNKQFASNGIFEDSLEPYRVEIRKLSRKNLTPINEEESSRIFHQFLEILRHNVVSDTGNAFNKIFSLFLCKVIDEDRKADDILDFQWLDGKDTEKTLLGRLSSLYKRGMKIYLDKIITDYSEEDLKGQVDEKTLKIFEELRLHKNQDFAFIEIYNEESFMDNAKIVKEVVQLLEGKQIRYTHKQQFLGDFFELLLNKGFKQESGQFFTPVPLVRFIIKSLPISKIIDDKIKKGEKDFLPYVIDFACGAGHFLTEAMDILQKEVNEIDEEKLSPTQRTRKNTFLTDEFSWARDFIFGIERDYRLVKTTKLACFLHGDGEATITHASGLDPFNSDIYPEKLKSNSKENLAFDILIANPPYSVAGFKSTVKNGHKSFSLYADITDKSSEIEVLFIERMAQLLKPKGVAGIILPQSILNKQGNYDRARKLILENFNIRSIVNLGGNAFAATGTSTAIFFLEKKLKRVLLNTKEDYFKETSHQQVVIVDSPKKTEDEKTFLGYNFSDRRGSEGMRKEGGVLLDENNEKNSKRVNFYILSNMLGETIESVDDSLKDFVRVMKLKDLFNWEDDPFNNNINPNKLLKRTIKKKIKTLKLKDFCKIEKGTSITKKRTTGGNIPVIAGGQRPAYYHNKANRTGEVITVSSSGSAGFVNFFRESIFASDCTTIQSKDKDIRTDYLYYVLKYIQDDFYQIATSQNVPHVYAKDFKNFIVPIVTKDEQDKLAEDLNKKMETIFLYEKIINDFFPSFNINDMWDRIKLSSITKIESGGTPSTKNSNYYAGGKINWATLVDVKGKYVFNTKRKITEEGLKNSSAKLLPIETVLFSSRATIGEVSIAKVELSTNQGFKNFICDKSKIMPKFLYYSLLQNRNNIKELSGGMKYKEINATDIGNFKIPLPSLKEQNQIIKELDDKEYEIDELRKKTQEIREEINSVIANLWE